MVQKAVWCFASHRSPRRNRFAGTLSVFIRVHPWLNQSGFGAALTVSCARHVSRQSRLSA